jgi:hypothetical protein
MANLSPSLSRTKAVSRTGSYSRFWAQILIWACRRCPH